MPHRVQVQQELVLVADVVIQVIDIGDIAHAEPPDLLLEDKGINLGLIYAGGIAGRAPHTFRSYPGAQPGDVAGHRRRQHPVLSRPGQLAADLLLAQRMTPPQEQQPQQRAFLAGDRFFRACARRPVAGCFLHDREPHRPPCRA